MYMNKEIYNLMNYFIIHFILLQSYSIFIRFIIISIIVRILHFPVYLLFLLHLVYFIIKVIMFNLLIIKINLKTFIFFIIIFLLIEQFLHDPIIQLLEINHEYMNEDEYV
jgi:hypothetical protein